MLEIVPEQCLNVHYNFKLYPVLQIAPTVLPCYCAPQDSFDEPSKRRERRPGGMAKVEEYGRVNHVYCIFCGHRPERELVFR